MRYIELNPVRAGMVEHPGSYRWSSYCQNATGAPNGLLTAHAEYLRLGTDRKSRHQNYLGLFETSIGEEDLNEIRNHAAKCRALGSKEFRDSLSAQLGRPAGIVRPGRKRAEKAEKGSDYFAQVLCKVI